MEYNGFLEISVFYLSNQKETIPADGLFSMV